MSHETNTRPANIGIEICNQCLREINTKGYYSGNRDGKHYYVHAACFKDWMSRADKQ